MMFTWIHLLVAALIGAIISNFITRAMNKDKRKVSVPTKELQKDSPKAKRSNQRIRDCKMVICVRTDLGMTKGKVAAQCCHATLAAYKEIEKRDPEVLRKWEDIGQAKITLKVKDEDEMLQLQKKARAAGLVAVSIQDAGRTQIMAGSRTVLAVGPGPIELIDSITGHLSLY